MGPQVEALAGQALWDMGLPSQGAEHLKTGRNTGASQSGSLTATALPVPPMGTYRAPNVHGWQAPLHLAAGLAN